MIVYEGGEALRYDELAIRAGVRGVLGVMRELRMLRAVPKSRHGYQLEPVVACYTGMARCGCYRDGEN